jgi:hypothetical protein
LFVGVWAILGESHFVVLATTADYVLCRYFVLYSSYFCSI